MISIFKRWNEEQGLKFIRENIGLFILIPTFLGGIWQLLSLSSISPSYIRFFSISQVVPDGILILLFIVGLVTPLFISVKLAVYFAKLEKKSSLTFIGKLFNFLNFIVICVLLYYGFKYSYIKIFNHGHPSIYHIILFHLVVTIMSLLILAFLCILLKLPTDNEKLNTPIIVILTLYTIGYIYFSGFCFMIFNTQYSIPNNLQNLSNIKCKISFDNYNVKYFNDSYIFIEELNSNNQAQGNYQVLKFEDLMEECE